MKDENGFKPFIPADKVVPEVTAVSVILGILLAVLFGAANAYLGIHTCGSYLHGCYPGNPQKGFHSGKQHGADHWFCR